MYCDRLYCAELLPCLHHQAQNKQSVSIGKSRVSEAVYYALSIILPSFQFPCETAELIALLESIHSDYSGFQGPFDLSTIANASIFVAHLAAFFTLPSHLRSSSTSSIPIQLDSVHACLAFHSDRYLRVNQQTLKSPWSEFSGFYECKGSEFIQLHTNYPLHLKAVCTALNLTQPITKAEVAKKLMNISASEAETKILAAGGASYKYRSEQEFEQTTQYKALLERKSVIELQLFENNSKQQIDTNWKPALVRSPSFSSPLQPLTGIRVLALTHVIAGPVAVRTLASYGADVIRVSAAHLPTLEVLDLDTGFGQTDWLELDFHDQRQKQEFLDLVRTVDIVVLGFRPGAFESLGLGVKELMCVNPGLIVAQISAWGLNTPWETRRGFDTLISTATGLVHTHTNANSYKTPTYLPAQPNDYGAGYLLAAGILRALALQVENYKHCSELACGYVVSTSLAQVMMWIKSLPKITAAAPKETDEKLKLCAAKDVHEDAPWQGTTISHIKPVGTIDGIQLKWNVGPPKRPSPYPTM